MRILNVKIKDFRNIVRADINFGKLNVLTGKNSSGKSNFLLALSNSLNLDGDNTELFSNNVVTYHPGKDNCTITTQVGDIKTNICYLEGVGEDDPKNFFCVNPESFEFEKVIDKLAFTKKHTLFYTGSFYENPKDGPLWSVFNQKRKSFLPSYTHIERQEVYREVFSSDTQQGGTKVVKTSKSDLPRQESYKDLFRDYQGTVTSWIKSNTKNGSSMNSESIHEYVVERHTSDIYELVAEKIKAKDEFVRRLSNTTFEKSKFIFLLADIQRNKKRKESLKSDLTTYTKGILNDAGINAKGEIVVTSPNGPQEIWTISNGTAVLLFFIVLLNWVKLTSQEKSYKSPNVMIFDEIDSIIHPTLIAEFKEVLASLSESIQIFITSHSPYFIDHFDKSELYLLKDTPSLPGTKKLLNRCNIYDYRTIINQLPEDKRKEFQDQSNSELFVHGLIDAIFPNSQIS